MRKPPPTEHECLSAAADYPLQQLADKTGRRRWKTYSYTVVRKGRHTSGSITDPVTLGSLHIAAGFRRVEVNAALRRAAALLNEHESDVPRSLLESALALSLLRYGWRRCGGDEANFAAEMNSQVDPDNVVASIEGTVAA